MDELRDLGPDGVPYIVALTKNADPKVAKRADEVLEDLQYDYYEYVFAENPVFDHFNYQQKTQGGFNHYNIPVAKAYKALDAYFTGDSPLRDAVTDRLPELTTAPPVPTTEGATEP